MVVARHAALSRWTPVIAACIVLAVSLSAALAFERVYDVRIQTRPPDPLALAVNATDTANHSPLPLRLVDVGGVGIPLDEWGQNYSHDRRVFRAVILESSPYINTTALQRVEEEWHSYVERVLQYGNNAITVPLLLELIDFNRVTAQGEPPGTAVYGERSTFRARHAAVRKSFSPLFEWADRRGMQVFLEADMLTLSTPLADFLRRVAPGAGSFGIDASNPAVWEVYRQGLEELFETMPSVKGLVIRFGEGGALYNTEGWPYRSEVAVRNASSLRAMLRGLLPAFEKTGRTLVLRSWTVGVGNVGRLHIDPRIYESVLGDIDSPALVVSTKFTAGDFFSYLPLNATLAQGRHRRLIEFQAKPEFEGFAAFPDFLGDEYARALRSLRAANPHIVGTYIFTQAGGPLRVGPRMLYPHHGFWLWADANVFAASRLAVEPSADVEGLAREWAARTFSPNPRIVDAVTTALTEGRKAVLDGFYIRPFAEREVRVPGLELPPLMWIFEWNMVGGWHSLLSLVYHGTRDDVDAAIREGNTSAASVRAAREQLEMAVAATGPGHCLSCTPALRSLEYQETLFDVLAAWRQAFLSYYRWLDSGSAQAWAEWRSGRERFHLAARRHVERFGNDLDFPALDLTSAARAIAVAERGAVLRSVATTLVIVVLALVIAGGLLIRLRQSRSHFEALSAVARLTCIVAMTPWRLPRESIDLKTTATVSALSLALIGFLAGALTGFVSSWIGGASILLFGIVAVAFESSANGDNVARGRGRLVVAAVGPLIPGALVMLSLIAYLNPLGFWYGFWTSPEIRVAIVTIIIAMPLWTTYVLLAVHVLHGWRAAVAGWLTAAGAGLLVVVTLLPEWPVALRSLDRPLNFAPATDTMLFALQTYVGVHVRFGGLAVVGVLLLTGGFLMQLRSQRRVTEATASGQP
jgi:hypothetical protein